VAKILAYIFLGRLQPALDPIIMDTQYGFRPEKGTSDAVFLWKILHDKMIKNGNEMHTVFIDLTRAFDTIRMPNFSTKLCSYKQFYI
jgi:hypothetical protein